MTGLYQVGNSQDTLINFFPTGFTCCPGTFRIFRQVLFSVHIYQVQNKIQIEVNICYSIEMLLHPPKV